jgi:molecular chaperone HtpG
MPKVSLLRLEKTLLFNKLIEKEINDHELSEKIKKIVEYLSPLLARIPENMPEFTLHDSNHSAKVVEIMGDIIPAETMKNLNIIEVGLLILAAYLHDIGMTCSPEERKHIINNSDDYKLLFKLDTIKNEEFHNAKRNNNHRLADFIEDQAFTEYLRRNHVIRTEKFIKEAETTGNFKCMWNGVPFHKHLISICNSHGEPVKSLYDLSIWPRNTLVSNKIINIQYLAIILRLADILDLDPERTPKVIYEFINPQNPISIIEWQKHRSIIGWSISYDKVVFEAECNQPEVERALRQFIEWIEVERKESIELMNKFNDDTSKKYKLNLVEPITTERIRSDGSYLYCDLKFQLEYKKVLELLMGERLYRNPILAIRELLQNSIDGLPPVN